MGRQSGLVPILKSNHLRTGDCLCENGTKILHRSIRVCICLKISDKFVDRPFLADKRLLPGNLFINALATSAAKSPDPPALQKMHPRVPSLPSRLDKTSHHLTLNRYFFTKPFSQHKIQKERVASSHFIPIPSFAPAGQGLSFIIALCQDECKKKLERPFGSYQDKAFLRTCSIVFLYSRDGQ